MKTGRKNLPNGRTEEWTNQVLEASATALPKNIICKPGYDGVEIEVQNEHTGAERGVIVPTWVEIADNSKGSTGRSCMTFVCNCILVLDNNSYSVFI